MASVLAHSVMEEITDLDIQPLRDAAQGESCTGTNKAFPLLKQALCSFHGGGSVQFRGQFKSGSGHSL